MLISVTVIPKPNLSKLSKLNAAPYLCGVHKPCPLLYGQRPCECSTSGQLTISLVNSLIPRLTIVIFGLGMSSKFKKFKVHVLFAPI